MLNKLTFFNIDIIHIIILLNRFFFSIDYGYQTLYILFTKIKELNLYIDCFGIDYIRWISDIKRIIKNRK